MRKMLLRILFVSLFFIRSASSAGAQESLTDIANLSVDNEQETFRKFIAFHAMDSRIRKHLEDFAGEKVDSIQQELTGLDEVDEDLRSRCIRSLTFFMRGLNETLKKNKLNAYEVPDLIQRYLQIQYALVRKQPFLSYLSDMGPVRSQLIANALWQFNFSSHMDQLATYKRVASSPDYILSYLESSPDFFYRDSLVRYLARTDPMRLAIYVQRNNNTLSGKIRQHPDSSVQQIMTLLPERNLSELVPFSEQLANHEMTIADILETRKHVNDYYQLLVNTIIHNKEKEMIPDTVSFQPALRQALHEKALAFYIKPINEQHASRDAVRFASVRNLRPADLYYILVTGQDDLYTSSYLGLYNRLMGFYKNQNADSLLQEVHYDQFRKFLRLAANYNTLVDFLNHMSEQARADVIRRFISGVDQNIEEGLQDAMDIADAFIPLSQNDTLNVMVQREIAENLERSFESQSFFGVRLYSILQQVFNAIDKDEAAIRMFSQLGDYESLSWSALAGQQGTVSQVVQFYGDPDGELSFKNFLALFRDTARWTIDSTSQWISIHSKPDERLAIYANRPLDNERGLDLAAQDSLWAYLDSMSIEPSVLIHRGHSYHLKYSLARLQPSVRLAILGSCGSYNNILRVANLSPEAQIIASRQVGSMTVNDPLLNLINRQLLQEQDLVWKDVWAQMEGELKASPAAYLLFQEYVPPNKNIGLFVLKLYNYGEPD